MQQITVTIGVCDDRGTITLYQPMRDILRAILIRWIRQGERGEQAAREMLRARMREMKEGQLDYYRNGISYMSQRLASQITDTIPLRQELEIIAGLSEDQPIPASWLQYVEHAESMGDTDGTLGTAGGGSRELRGEESDGEASERGGLAGAADGAGGRCDRGRLRGPLGPDDGGGEGGDAKRGASRQRGPTGGGPAGRGRKKAGSKTAEAG